MERIHPVEGENHPSGSHIEEETEDGLPLCRIMDMVPEPHTQQKGEGFALEGKALLGIRNNAPIPLGPGRSLRSLCSFDHRKRVITAHQMPASFTDQLCKPPVPAWDIQRVSRFGGNPVEEPFQYAGLPSMDKPLVDPPVPLPLVLLDLMLLESMGQ